MSDHGYQADDVDRLILNAVQEDARFTATELAERVGVSDNTIHNRLDRLEADGIITGYHASLNPDRLGLTLHILYRCTADIIDRETHAQHALAIPEVHEVTELMTGEGNLLVKAVCALDEDVTRIAQELVTSGLTVHDETIIRHTHTQPLDLLALEDRIPE